MPGQFGRVGAILVIGLVTQVGRDLALNRGYNKVDIIVLHGRLFTGAHGFSGELAHVQVAPEGPACICGNRGCLITQPAVRRWPGRSTP